jgi:hypothetical protein
LVEPFVPEKSGAIVSEKLNRLTGLVSQGLGFRTSVPPLREGEREIWTLAREHKVATILAPAVLEAGSPASLVDEARYLWQLAALRETYYVGKCDEIVTLLAAAGIRAFPLKGIPLARHAYPKRGFRAFRDLDLLVHPEHVFETDRILKNEGFAILKPHGPLERGTVPAGDPVRAATERLEAVSYQKGDLFLEIHVHLLPKMLGEYSLNHVWNGEVLPPEDFFIHLLFHATRHHFLFGLRQLADIAVWAGKVRSMGVVEEKLRSNDLLWLAWPAWKLASEFFPVEVPEPPATQSHLAVNYTRAVRRRFENIPTRAIGLSGSPIPFVLMRGRWKEALWGSKRQAEYQLGTGSSGFRAGIWKAARPFVLAWRHAPVVWRLLRFGALFPPF